MHAHAVAPMPLFDTLFSATEDILANNSCGRSRKFPCPDPIRSSSESLLTLTRLYERLSLLAQLELPCTISIINPPVFIRDTVIRSVALNGEDLSISGDDFNLHLRGANIHSIRLSNGGDMESSVTSLDIHHANDLLYARIEATPDDVMSAVWRDVMDNPALSLA